MKAFCLDLEGVMIPEIWINVAKKFKCNDLKLTTRDIPDYNKLMRYRIGILKREKLKLKDIQCVIETMKPMPGAKNFLAKLKAQGPVLILSDTFYEFAGPLMAQLDHPTLFCNWLKVDSKGFIVKHVLRQQDGKRKAVRALHQIGFHVHASGDSYNDLTMLQAAKRGVLYNPPVAIRKKYKKYPVAKDLKQLYQYLTRA